MLNVSSCVGGLPCEYFHEISEATNVTSSKNYIADFIYVGIVHAVYTVSLDSLILFLLYGV